MNIKNKGRLAPAFILLALSIESNHGLGVFNMLKELFPENRLDTAIIYRKLKELEKNECIISHWVNSEIGPKKKVYEITDKGELQLEKFHHDIKKKVGMLSSFIEICEKK